jgi:RNA polymerase sigma-70 factor (ECF subfamily)
MLDECRGRLRQAVALRLDPRIAGRVDPSDVVQEAALEATGRYAEYLSNPTLPPHLWLRLITIQRLALVHRQHLGVKARDARREVHPVNQLSLDYSEVNLQTMADWMIDRSSSPSRAASRNELRAQVQAALAQLEPIDRELLSLRHFEQMSHAEAAQVMAITESAASKRYLRALRKMRAALALLGIEGN